MAWKQSSNSCAALILNYDTEIKEIITEEEQTETIMYNKTESQKPSGMLNPKNTKQKHKI